MAQIAARWLPPARTLHPCPQQRFIVQHPRWEPSAVGANPVQYSHDPAVLRKIAAVREQTRLAALLPSANAWLAVVRSLYSARFWDGLAERWQYDVTFCRA